MPNFFTVGYQGETADSFFNKLHHHKIKLLIDIRQNPFSFKKGFSRAQLQLLSRQNGISYIHIKELGTPIPLRNYLKDTGNYPEFFERYSNFLTEYEDLVEDLVSLSDQTRICIVCFEKTHTECHRQIVANRVRQLSGNMIVVCHL